MIRFLIVLIVIFTISSNVVAQESADEYGPILAENEELPEDWVDGIPGTPEIHVNDTVPPFLDDDDGDDGLQLNHRIVNGRDASINEFPYQLSLQKYGSHICGASIISSDWALTAAHCVHRSYAIWFSLRAGSSNRGQGGTVHNAHQIVVHPKYSKQKLDYDYAVIRVKTKFPIGRPGVAVIPLTTTEPKATTKCVVTGWGMLRTNGPLPTKLQQLNVPIVSRLYCGVKYFPYFTNRMICAGFKMGFRNTCNGDSGGPLVCGGKQVGIASFVSSKGCAATFYPGGYANVAEQRAWIRSKTGV